MTKTRVAAIPAPTDANLRDVARAVKNVLDVREGLIGDPLDRNVTLRDLVDGGLADATVVSRGGGSGSVNISPAPGLGSGNTEQPDLTPPPQPTGLTASAGLALIILEWAAWSYGNHAYTEIWRSSTDVIGNALLIGTSDTRFYSDAIGSTGVTYFYWVRFRSTADVTGPYNSTNGVQATTGKIGNVDLSPLIVEAGNLANGSVSASKLAPLAVDATKFANDIEPVTLVTSIPTTRVTANIFNTTTGKLYRWNGTAYTKDTPASDVDARGLNILSSDGTPVFSSTGEISSTAYVNVNSNNVLLSTVAANSLVPSLNYVGEFASAPTQAQLGASWRQNSVYKNSTDGKSYVLTGTPLGWVVYLADGQSFTLTIESTNGTIFRRGQSTTTLLKAHLFKNGAEVTDVTPTGWFRWRRVSAIPQAPPNDDATWNNLYQTGYTQVSINVDDVYARATFFCDVISS
ncbi:MAG: hypothetical protein RJA99_3181 [Pseudomonadota bacterium]|jgi:hypothetical protein